MSDAAMPPGAAAEADQAAAKGVRVILLTPTPDQGAKLDDPADPLNQQAEMIRALAANRGLPLIDSLALFKAKIATGGVRSGDSRAKRLRMRWPPDSHRPE